MPPCTGPGPCGDCGGIAFTTNDDWINVTQTGGCNFDLGWERANVAGLVDDGPCSIIDYDTINFTPGKITSKIGPPLKVHTGTTLSGGTVGSITWPSSTLSTPIDTLVIDNTINDVCTRDARYKIWFHSGITVVTPTSDVMLEKDWRVDVTYLVDIDDGAGFVGRARQSLFSSNVSFSPIPDSLSYALGMYMDMGTLPYPTAAKTFRHRKQVDLVFGGPGPVVLNVDEAGEPRIWGELDWQG